MSLVLDAGATLPPRSAKGEMAPPCLMTQGGPHYPGAYGIDRPDKGSIQSGISPVHAGTSEAGCGSLGITITAACQPEDR